MSRTVVGNCPRFSWDVLIFELRNFQIVFLLKMVDVRRRRGVCALQFSFIQQQVGSQPLWPGCHDNYELLLLLPWLPLLSAEPQCKLPVPAGSARQWRAKTEAPPHTHTRQARAQAFTLCLEGPQALGLTQVPATHLGLAGREL